MFATASNGGAPTPTVLARAETRIHRIEHCDDGIIRIQFVEGAYVELDDCEAQFAAYKELTDDRPFYVLVDMANLKGASSEARAFGNRDDFVAEMGGLALVTRGAVTRTIGNIFLRLTRPRYPTRMFTSPVAASMWLAMLRGDDR